MKHLGPRGVYLLHGVPEVMGKYSEPDTFEMWSGTNGWSGTKHGINLNTKENATFGVLTGTQRRSTFPFLKWPDLAGLSSRSTGSPRKATWFLWREYWADFDACLSNGLNVLRRGIKYFLVGNLHFFNLHSLTMFPVDKVLFDIFDKFDRGLCWASIARKFIRLPVAKVRCFFIVFPWRSLKNAANVPSFLMGCWIAPLFVYIAKKCIRLRPTQLLLDHRPSSSYNVSWAKTDSFHRVNGLCTSLSW